MCTVTIDIDLDKPKVKWLDDRTFIVEDGRKFRMLPESDDDHIKDDYTSSCCDKCALNIEGNREKCKLDTDWMFENIACWTQSETNSQSQDFYYFELVVD